MGPLPFSFREGILESGWLEGQITDRYPNLFITGAAKAGTMSLYEYLRASPVVYMCPVKEPHCFSPDAVKNPGTHQRVVDRWDAYVRLFAGATSEIAIDEADPLYLWDKRSLRTQRQGYHRARDPVDRPFALSGRCPVGLAGDAL
jgi:hypothetical protein